MTEPDISQLMEDLETVSREKEKYLEEKIRAEQKYENVAKKTEKEKVCCLMCRGGVVLLLSALNAGEI